MTSHTAPTPVTVLGLGPMGRALARAFLNNGHPTTVWNRSAGKADALVGQGAGRAETAAGAISASPLVVVCVLDHKAVRAILDSAPDALKGRTLVNLTSSSPEHAREFADWAAAHGVDYLDGSIMTPVETIGGPGATILYSGASELYESHRPTLASLGGTATYLGADPGRAAAYDVALLDLFWTTMSGYVHALALAGEQNITARELAPYAKGIVGLMSGIIDIFTEHVDNGRYPGEGSNLISAAAGMDHIIHAAQNRGLDVGVLSAAQDVAQQAIDAGHGADGFSRLVDVLRKQAQVV